jgi:anti-sigma regulatory factor (Ser/Thr protein kinase)
VTQNSTEPEGLDRHPGYTRTLPREPETAAVARGLARTALAAWGQDGLIDDAVLILTELVSNAVKHGRMSSIRVIVSRPTENWVRVGVVERSRIIPVLRTDSNEDDTDGRGLVLVDALSDRWGTDVHSWGGKTIWGELKCEVSA